MQTVDNTARESASCTPRDRRFRDLGWPNILPMAVAVGLLLWLYWPIFNSWYVEWMKKESYYSHAVLVPFISAFIVWLKREDILNAPIRPSALGYLMILPGLAVFTVMSWAGGYSLQGLVFPMILGGFVLVFFGRHMARLLRFPVGYLFFMAVLPGDVLTKLSFRIQMISTVGATWMLNVVGLDATREGARINLPNIEVMVGAPCSGFRMLISLFAFAVLLAYLKEGPMWGRASMVIVTLPLSVILNAFRVFMIAMVGEYFGSDAMRTFHDSSGYIVLALAFVVLSFFARLVKCQKFNSILVSS
jgi:exosortase